MDSRLLRCTYRFDSNSRICIQKKDPVKGSKKQGGIYNGRMWKFYRVRALEHCRDDGGRLLFLEKALKKDSQEAA